MIARDAYFWAWPLVNIYNKRLNFKDVPEPMMVGPGPAAPLNQVAMLTDYIDPEERLVACPNQDVVYGAGSLALDVSPVVIQVPDFGDRFWVYQMVDLRTDGFVQLGKMYGTTPGFYLLVGPNWRGDVPKGITKVFRSSDQHRLCRATRVPGRHAGRQEGHPERADADHDVSAGGIRRADEEHRLEQDQEDPGGGGAARRKRNGCFRKSSSTSFPTSSPTRRPCRARSRATRRCVRCLKRSSVNPS